MDERMRVSQRQERRLAKVTGAKQHAGSGSGAKGHDMHTDDELIECKTVLRGKKSITLKDTDLDSLCYQAAIQDVRPVLHVELGSRRWCLVPEDEWYDRSGE